MTREEAIKEIEKTIGQVSVYLPSDDDWIIALKLAIDALRGQKFPTKLDGSRLDGFDGCVVCNRCGVGGSNELLCNGTEAQYCPFCGRPLTEEAEAELKKREEDNESD